MHAVCVYFLCVYITFVCASRRMCVPVFYVYFYLCDSICECVQHLLGCLSFIHFFLG